MREHFELRAREPVAQCLIRRLVVPRIYFDAPWPKDDSARFDVLAIDRDGNGDAHVARIRRVAEEALDEASVLLAVGAPFRWIAFPDGTEDEKAALALMSKKLLYAKGSAGRIGDRILRISQGRWRVLILSTRHRLEEGARIMLRAAASGAEITCCLYSPTSGSWQTTCAAREAASAAARARLSWHGSCFGQRRSSTPSWSNNEICWLCITGPCSVGLEPLRM